MCARRPNLTLLWRSLPTPFRRRGRLDCSSALQVRSCFVPGGSGSELVFDGVPLETTPAERSFANLLSASGIASICFGRGLERHEFAQFIRAFMESGSKSKGLAEKLSEFSGKDSSGSIRVNEIRF